MRYHAHCCIWFFGLAASLLPAGVSRAQISSIPDEVIEQCLTEGDLGKRAGKLVGLTKPEHLQIDCAAPVDSAVFKSLDEHRRGITRLPGGSTEMNFSDSYKYERAAYLLDRELDLNMVPVAVIRSIKGDEGALVAWIPNASHEAQMEQQPTGPQMADLARQKAIMRLYDALIFNVDRRQENWLVDNESWKLYLIDHSRAFRDRRDLPEDFLSQRTRLTTSLHQNLEALNQEQLVELMDDLITETQIRSLLERRDRILEKIEQDRDDYGEEVIFTDWAADR